MDNLVKAHGLAALLLDEPSNNYGHDRPEESKGDGSRDLGDSGKEMEDPSSSDGKTPISSFPLPPYIKRLPHGIPQEDIQYLWIKGALSVPDSALRDKLIQAFIYHVYPALPLINLQEFVSIVSKEGKSDNKISLLLFQAIMFAGAAFVDLSFLQTAGYSTRREARRAFYQKARVSTGRNHKVECD